MSKDRNKSYASESAHADGGRDYVRGTVVFAAVALLACTLAVGLAGTVAAQADSVTVETQPNATQTAGEVITGDAGPYPQANVTDVNGAGVADVNVTVEAINGTGSLVGTTTNVTNSTGIATFDNLTIETADTGYRLNFSIDSADTNVDASDNNTTQTFDVEAANADSVQVETQPDGTQTAGQNIAGPPSANVTDQYGNAVQGVDVTVQANGPGSLTGTSTTQVTTDTVGIAVFNNLEIQEAGSYNLSFSIDTADPNVTANDEAQTNNFTVEAANANSVTVQTEPDATQTAGSAITGPPEAFVTDQYGNPVPSVNVSVAEVGGYTFDSGTTTQSTNTSGTALFGDLVINTADTGYQLEFSIDNADGNVDTSDTAQSQPFEVQADTVANITAYNVTATAGQQGEINVTAEDAYGNPVDGETVTVDADGGLGGVTAGDAQTTGADGNATFTFNETTAGSYTVTFSASGGSITDDATVTVGADAPDTVTASTVTGAATADGAAELNYTVTVEDAFGNPVEGTQVATTSNGSNVTYPGGQNQTTDANGEVTVTATSTDAQDVQFTFTEQSQNNNDTATGTFGAGTPAQVTATSNVATSAADGVSELNYTVTVEDANNNPVGGVTVNTTDDGTNIDYAGDDSQQTDASGQVVVTATSTDAQNVQFTFTEQSQNNNDTATGTFEAGNTTGLNLGFAQNELSQGDGNTNALTVSVQDAQGNPITGENVTLTVQQGNGQFVVGGTEQGQSTTVTTDNGGFSSQVVYRQTESDSGMTVTVQAVDGSGQITEEASYSVGELDRRELSRGDDSDQATGTDRRDLGRGDSTDRDTRRDRSRNRAR